MLLRKAELKIDYYTDETATVDDPDMTMSLKFDLAEDEAVKLIDCIRKVILNEYCD
jgi:hypothetical protein